MFELTVPGSSQVHSGPCYFLSIICDLLTYWGSWEVKGWNFKPSLNKFCGKDDVTFTGQMFIKGFTQNPRKKYRYKVVCACLPSDPGNSHSQTLVKTWSLIFPDCISGNVGYQNVLLFCLRYVIMFARGLEMNQSVWSRKGLFKSKP